MLNGFGSVALKSNQSGADNALDGVVRHVITGGGVIGAHKHTHTHIFHTTRSSSSVTVPAVSVFDSGGPDYTAVVFLGISAPS